MVRAWAVAMGAMLVIGSTTFAVAGDAEDCVSKTIPADRSAAACRRLAEDGNAAAQYNLGVMYHHGLGVAQSDGEAAKWIRRAAEQGIAEAQHNLGAAYATGEGVPQDYGEAAKWFRRAAEQGDADAQCFLGSMYIQGQGVPKDSREAANWFRRAAEQGQVEAQYNVGLMYGAGMGVPQDYVQEHMWLYLAAASLPPGEYHDNAIRFRDHAASLMTPAQIEETQRLAREWKPKPETRRRRTGTAL